MEGAFKQKMKDRLLAKELELSEKMKKYSHAPHQIENPDEDDIAQQATEGILQESLYEAHKLILNRVKVALEKIEKGVYGICEECGTKVREEDLEKEPWIEYCGGCNNE